MSVIVMGMEMPKSCRECCLEAEGYYCVPIEVQNKDNDVWLRTQYWGDIGERPDWCPLRPLPEKHGRLIDAKVLDAAFTALRFNDDGTLRHWDDRKNWCLHGGEVESLIADAPTIVEAEGE